MVPPVERFRLAAERDMAEPVEPSPAKATAAPAERPAGVVRWVDQRGQISLARFTYKVGRVFAGEPVEALCQGGLVQVTYKGVVVATHAQRRRPEDPTPASTPQHSGRSRPATSGMTVKRMADAGGTISFAGASYRAGRAWARTSIDVAIVGASVQLSVDGKVIRSHAIRHDRTKEHGAFATPNGRPRRAKTA